MGNWRNLDIGTSTSNDLPYIMFLKTVQSVQHNESGGVLGCKVSLAVQKIHIEIDFNVHTGEVFISRGHMVSGSRT